MGSPEPPIAGRRVPAGESVRWAIWLALLIVIPVTSFPLVSSLMGAETTVGPLAMIPLAGLAVLWLGPYLLTGQPLPTSSAPLISFALLALLSAAVAVFLPIDPYKGQTVFGREIRALTTLAIGIGFYLCAVTLPDSDSKIASSLRALYLGAAVMLAWSLVQAWVVLREADHVPLVVTQFHHWFSVRDPLVDRVTGLAYEPSWLGNQLAVLYVPLWFASVVARRSVFSASRTWFSVELILLVAGVVILALTRSRISLLSLMGAMGMLYLVAGWRFVGGWVLRQLPPGAGALPRRLAAALVIVALLLGLVVAAVTAAWGITQIDNRMDPLADVQGRVTEAQYLYPNEAVYELGNRLSFAERLVYWTVALRTFSEYPVLGVGPGNTGFFFESNRPAYGSQLTEIRKVIEDPSFGFPNPKNLWLRILAENGILGFAFFAAWFSLVGLASLSLWSSANGISRVIGLAGGLAAAAQVVEGFSLDTYALPQMWIIFGLVAAVAWRHSRHDSLASPIRRP